MDRKAAYFDSLEAKLLQARRQEARLLSRTQMMPFMKLTMPHPEAVDDVRRSQFQETPLARLLTQIIEKIDSGGERRVCVSVGPQFGKSQILSRGGPAWLSGKNPYRHIMLGAYNDDFAQEFGGDVRHIMQSEEYSSIFPDHALRRGSESKSSLVTTRGGKIAFVGVGGSGTGKPADIFIVEDPYRNSLDAESASYRDKVWDWFTSVAHTRTHKDSAIIVVHTRWHDDDLIGRLADPDHPERDTTYKGIADDWRYYNLPAIVQDEKLARALGLTMEVPTDPKIIAQFGEKPMVSLWEERKSLRFLSESKQLNKRVFGALYMGSPSPEDGIYFRDTDIKMYHDISQLPKNLVIYGASDHGATKNTDNDPTVIGCVGIDENDEIWVLPDLVWDHLETDQTVEALMDNMKRNQPQVWWLEDELISKSFGPFLRKRMYEERCYTYIQPKKPSKDKKTRARSIQGRMQQGMVHFPAFAPWWQEAKKQLLKFPFAKHDDFVDWLAWIGLGLTEELTAVRPKIDKVVATNTFAWIKAASNRQQRLERARKAAAGW